VSFLIDSILLLAILLSVFCLGASRLGTTIRIFAMQSCLLAVLPWLLHGGLPGFHDLLLMIGTIVVKVWLIPMFLARAIRDVAIRRDVEPLIGTGASLFVGSILVALAFVIAASLPLPTGVASSLLVPASLSTLLLGFLMIISRTKAVTQVVGYLLVENGIFLFGVSLAREMPLLVEMGILLDAFVAVFVMGIVIFRINREFEHMDTSNLTVLRD
jgi:hydrogenase-4 component E